MGRSSILSTGFRLRATMLPLAFVIASVAPRVGSAQSLTYPQGFWNSNVRDVNLLSFGTSPKKKLPQQPGPEGEKKKEEASSAAKSGGNQHMIEPPKKDKEKEKEKDEDKKQDQEKDTGIKVNGQTLWEDSKGKRYYYVNGDKNSPFISVEQPDGSFKWSTKNAMLNPVQAGQYGEIGMIETNGKLSTMYQLPDGSRVFRDGEMWKVSQPGKNSFTATDKISFPNGSGTLTQYPGVGVTEPYKFGGGTGGGAGSDALFGGSRPTSGEFGGSGGNSQIPTTTIPASSGSGLFTASGVPVPQSIVDQASAFGTPQAYSIENGVWQACYGFECRQFP